jgi:hypothetical protein
MTPRVRTAFGRAAPYGLVWGILTPLTRWHGEPHSEALTDGAIWGAIAFTLPFLLAFFFPSWGRRRPRPSQDSN